MKIARRIIMITTAIILGIFGFLWVRHYIEEKAEDTIEEDSTNNSSDDNNNTNTVNPPQTNLIQLDETPAYQGAKFFVKQPVIEDQQAYVAIPLEYDSNTPPTIIVYSHGSDTTITRNLTSDFMQQMQDYGEFFTTNNYIFAASAMHDANWGSDESVADMLNLIEWIKTNYTAAQKIDLIGFSMGGWPTFMFAFAHPEMVSHIASLAGTTKPSTWTAAQIQKLIPIQVSFWHGNADVNVKYSTTEKMVDLCIENGVYATLNTIEGGTHYDVDWEYHEEILTFFNEV